VHEGGGRWVGSNKVVELKKKNTGMDSHSLLQGIFPDPGVEPGSPSLQADSLLSKPLGRFRVIIYYLGKDLV